MALTDHTENAPTDEADDDPGFHNIGCQIVCSSGFADEVVDEIAQRLREVLGEVLGDYTDVAGDGVD